MKEQSFSRRTMLKNAAITTGALCLSGSLSGAEETKPSSALHLASNQYSWHVYYQRDGRDFAASLDDGLKDVAASGINGYEASITTPDQITQLAPLLRKHNLEMRSIYVNSVLHDPAQAEKSIEQILTIAKKAKEIGVNIFVTNPSPIQWGGQEAKDDKQLITQANAMNRLGRELSSMGLILAYHNHDMELQNAAREFHHMMVGTDPRYVTLCLDAHWVYRGAGNSSVALFDIEKLYATRITELHLRQSINNVWAETFGEGDIDYPALARYLLNLNIKPHLVLEQAVEKGTPKTMDPVTVHQKSSAYVRRIFAAFAD